MTETINELKQADLATWQRTFSKIDKLGSTTRAQQLGQPIGKTRESELPYFGGWGRELTKTVNSSRKVTLFAEWPSSHDWPESNLYC
jgi:hypothetical protein